MAIAEEEVTDVLPSQPGRDIFLGRKVIEMNIKRFILAAFVVFFMYQITDAIIHILILVEEYRAITIWRKNILSTFWILYITSFIFSFIFVYIFIRGYEGKGILEGLRYGVLIGLFVNIPYVFNQYALYPLNFSLAIKWFVLGMIQIILCGVVTALVYEPKEEIP